MMKKIFLIIIFISMSGFLTFAQDETDSDSSSIEIFLIDAYVKPEPPYTFILTFYTSENCMSNVIIDGKYEYSVSNQLSESHSAKIDLTGINFLDKNVDFVIQTTDSVGNKSLSEVYEFDLPYEPVIKDGSTLWTVCLFAGSVFLIPAPGYLHSDGKDYFSLTKEISLLSFRSKNRLYPSSYISLEYTYIFNSDENNYFRLGYKKILPVDYIEYVSPGLTVYTNFNGQNGFGPEISVGWFSLFDTFTFYTRYRYNFRLNNSDFNYHEINLGFYTRFFSIYL